MKPSWLNKKIKLSEFDAMRRRLKKYDLHTVCEAASCPNISECYAKGEVTFLIGGDICTRDCLFCGVTKGNPSPLDVNEPLRVADAIKELALKYVVVTGVTRDDLADKASGHYAEVVNKIHEIEYDDDEEKVKVELLIPDFDAQRMFLEKIVKSKPDVIAHNLETVQRIYPLIGRDEYRFEVSLSVLESVKCIDKNMITKSGLMLGLGETEEEVLYTMQELREVDCDFLSLGQYLKPSASHFDVKEYINPEKFEYYKAEALKLGFKDVKSGPYVRSSYLAGEYRII